MLHDEPKEFKALRVMRDGRIERIDDAVQTEATISVYVNGILTVKLMCSKSNLAELVVGTLYSQGIIDAAGEVSELAIDEHAMRADVALAGRVAGARHAGDVAVPTYSSKNVVLDNSFARGKALEPVAPIAWEPSQIFRICDEFELDKTAHSRTRGSHSAYLCALSETLCLREDIGRHNAFDKCIGWALMNGVDLSQCLLYTSGRVPTDMVEKAIRARLPILVSKAVATDKTVEIAREYALTLICEGKSGCFTVMNDPLGVCRRELGEATDSQELRQHP